MTPLAFAGLSAIVVTAFSIEAALGFGATIVFVSLSSLLLRLPIAEVLPSFVPVNLVLSALIASRSRRDADLRLLFGRIFPAMLLGLPLGMWAFSRLPEAMLRRALGVFLLVLEVLPLVFRDRDRERAAPPAALPATASWGMLGLAGVLHGAFATGGPLVVYVLSRSPIGKATFRGTLSLLWALLAVVLLAKWSWSGFLTTSTLVLSGKLLPSMVVGLVVGDVLHRKVEERHFRGFVNAMLLVFGVILLVRG